MSFSRVQSLHYKAFLVGAFVVSIIGSFLVSHTAKASAVVPTISTYLDGDCSIPTNTFNLGDHVYIGGSKLY